MPEKNEYAHLLHEGERILWEGRPERRFPLTRRDGLIMFLVLAFMALLTAPWDGRPWDGFFAGVGVGFLLVLLFLPVFLMTTRRRMVREIYLLTDRRAMILVQESKGLALRDVRLLRRCAPVRVMGEGGGCATIYLGSQSKYEHYDWLFVPDGQAVAERIRSRAGSAGNIRKR